METETCNRVLACRQGDALIFQVSGHATSRHAPALRAFAEEGLAHGSVRVIVDLRECTHIDSTFLGTLLHLKRESSSSGAEAFALMAPSSQCLRVLRQMGVVDLFPTVSDEVLPKEDDWVELAGEIDRLDLIDFKRNVVDAHQELAHVSGPTGDRFRSLAEAVAREYGAERGRQHNGSGRESPNRIESGSPGSQLHSEQVQGRPGVERGPAQ